MVVRAQAGFQGSLPMELGRGANTEMESPADPGPSFEGEITFLFCF